MVGDPSSGERMTLCVMNSLNKNNARLASGKGARTAVVVVDKLVREIRNPAASCINFVCALSTVKLGLRTKPRALHPDPDRDQSAHDWFCICNDICSKIN